MPIWHGRFGIGVDSVRLGLHRHQFGTDQQFAVSSSAAEVSGHMEESMSTDARPSALVHATEELLEEYTFGRICEPQLGWLEEHLLICPECQTALDDIDEYRIFMKAGLSSLESERQAAAGRLNSPVYPSSTARFLQFARPRIQVTRILLAAAVLLVLAGATVWRMQPPVAMAPLATIKLVAFRGGEGFIARAPAGRPLNLVFGKNNLAEDLSYRVEVVNSSGRRMWSGRVRIGDQDLSIRVDQPLEAGAYWVRLTSSAGQLLREFGLTVE